MATEKITVVKVDTNPAQKSIKSLRQELKAVKDEMANLEEGSDAFLEAANKAGELKHQLDEINSSISGASADFGDLLATSGTALNGIIGGFQIANGLLATFGIENEDVIDTIKRLQAVMSIGQGIAQIDNGIKAMKKLSAAITGTTKAAKILKTVLQPKVFAAVTIAVTALATIFGKLKKKEDEAAAALEKHAEIVKEREAKAVEEANKQWEHNLNLKQKIYNIKFGGDDVKTLTQLLKDYEGELTKIQKAQQDVTDELNKSFRQAALNGQDTINVNDDLLKRQSDLAAEAEKYKKLIEETKIALEDARAIAKARVEVEAAEAAKERQEGLNKAYELGIDILKKYQDQAKEKIVPEFPEEDEEELDAITQRRIDAYTNFRHAVVDEYTQLLYTDEEYFRAAERNLELSLQARLISQEEYTEAVKRLRKEEVQYTLQNTATAAAGIADILNSIADAQDENNKEGFERSKKLQTSAAVINMLSGVTAAIAGLFTTKTGPWDIALAAIQAGSIIAAGTANIMKIQRQQYNSSAASVSSSALKNTIVPPVTYSSATQGAEIQSAIKDTRVYVTERDITSIQRKVHVAETENRF